MKVNGYILTYPLGYTNLDGDSSSVDEKIAAVEQALNDLNNELKNLDSDGDGEPDDVVNVAEFVQNLKDTLSRKADLDPDDNDTPDDPSDDALRVRSSLLRSDPNYNWDGE